MASGLAVAVLLIAGLLWFKTARDDQKALERRQESIERVTNDLEALLQRISPSAVDMIGAQPETKSLAKDAAVWTKTFKKAQTEMTSVIADAPSEVDLANRVMFQAVLQYVAAAETFTLVPDAPKELREKIIARAAAQVTAADGTWSSGVEFLNEKRVAAELDPAVIRAPSSAADPSSGSTIPPLGG